MEPETIAEAPAALPPRRGRPRIVREPKPIADVVEPVIASEDSPLREPLRVDMRAPLRAEDPRERAARRAAEVRANIGDMDEGEDEFRAPPAPDGWAYEWKRKTVLGAEDPAYQVELARKGWDPVPASRHPSYMPDKGNHVSIERKGMILMERPLELVEESKAIELRKARNQVRHKETQLNSAPDGQFERDNKGAPLTKIKKSYEAIPIPKE